MLSTLLKIGQWQSKGANEWDRFLEKPKVSYEDKKGNPIINYTLPIIFDLDKMDVVLDASNLKEYDETDVFEFKALKIQGGNNKAIYATTPSSKFIQFYKTFFGKEGSIKTSKGELAEAIDKDFFRFQGTEMYSILEKVFTLRDRFTELVSFKDDKKDKKEINVKTIEKLLDLPGNGNLALVYAAIRSSELVTPFAKIPDYEKFINEKFIGEKAKEERITSKSESLCYASGELQSDVEPLELANRYSLNKMFVTETRNYASFFNRDNFRINYQVGKENQKKLDYASTFLLNKFKTKIANIDHVIIPQFLGKSDIDLELVLNGVKKKSDLLFQFDVLENIAKDIKMETEDIFWINFVAFESDGNFFKSTETIKDVSQFHFENVLNAFHEIHWELKEAEFINWNSVMTEYGTKGRFFNFNSVYNQIPIRKDKEKKNVALELFKSILENRKIDKTQLFSHFKELMLCHYYGRYNSYTNIPKSTKDYFSKAIRDSVFKYHAFIRVLHKLNLIDMEETENVQSKENLNFYEQAILDFFAKMKLNQEQQAMFYLGRMLNAVEFIQIQKKIKKTVIQKVNFNGMDRDDIQRLRNDLFEKAKQHGKVGKVVFADRKFVELFEYNKWGVSPMDPNEALFFLLTGYSFGTSKKEIDEIEKIEAELAEN